MVFLSNSASDTEKIGKELAEELDRNGVRRAFIAMRGEMGVGKTAFTRGFASYFGFSAVRSPTYAIVNEYKNEKVNIFHFDMYRIEGDEDLYSIGFDDYIERDGYIIAEWSENIEDFIPEDAIYVSISRTQNDPDERQITINDSKVEK